MRKSSLVPGTILHYHATREGEIYGKILVLGATKREQIVLILLNPMIPQWPTMVGKTYTWRMVDSPSTDIYHTSQECDAFWVNT